MIAKTILSSGPLKDHLGEQSVKDLLSVLVDQKDTTKFVEKLKDLTMKEGKFTEAQYEQLTKMLTNTVTNGDMNQVKGLVAAMMTGQPEKIPEIVSEMQGGEKIIEVLEEADGGDGDDGEDADGKDADKGEAGGQGAGENRKKVNKSELRKVFF